MLVKTVTSNCMSSHGILSTSIKKKINSVAFKKILNGNKKIRFVKCQLLGYLSYIQIPCVRKWEVTVKYFLIILIHKSCLSGKHSCALAG